MLKSPSATRRTLGEAGHETTRARAMWGTTRTLVAANMVDRRHRWASRRPSKWTGVGYRAAMKGKNLQMQLGYSHDVDIYQPREGITIAVPKQTEIKISGIDKQVVGQARREDPLGSVRRSPTRARASAMRAKYVRRKEGKKK
jgi:large subunit ribosomal protein L6